MNVLVYSGPEVFQTSLKSTLSTLRSLLIPHYTVQPISQESLASHPWSTGCALFVFPGCRELFPSPFITVIRSYVENGGAFLALSAGATYSSSRVLDLNSLSISGLSKDQTLRFYDKATSSYLYPTFHSGEDITTLSDSLVLTSGEKLEGGHWSGAGEFIGIEGAKNIKALAHIGERVAAVRCGLSKGIAIVWALGIEFSRTADSEDSAITSWETRRLNIMREVLRDLGLHVPSEIKTSTTHPFPQFLAANPAKPEIVSQIMEALSGSMEPIEDRNDTFHFSHFAGNDYLQKDGTRLSYGIQPDSSSWQPKYIIVCRDGSLPSSQQAPLFNIGDYFSELSRARDITGIHKDNNPWGMGEALFYSEIVTSTQTMLDKYVPVDFCSPFLFISLPEIRHLCPSFLRQFYLSLRTN